VSLSFSEPGRCPTAITNALTRIRRVKLTASLYHECLLDRLQFLRFLVSLLESSRSGNPSDTLGQLSFIVTLIEDYCDDILENEPETARLASGCMTRLDEVCLELPHTLHGTATLD
jgi:hypothetical protein